jgi:DNA helicase-2/ATP-dependent DNA helicase PcrA
VKQIELGLEVEADLRRSRRALNEADPWFGQVDVQTEGGPVSYRVSRPGSKATRSVGPDGIPVVDWRHPASAPLFETPNPDRRVDVEVGGQPIRGRITGRARVHGPHDAPSVQAELFGAEDPARVPPSPPSPPSVGSGGSWAAGEAQTGLPDILGLITPEQYALITQTRDRPVLIQGRAGSGKTTVALYRLSWLAFPRGPDAPGIDPADMLIVMFNRALKDFVSQLIDPLGLQGARIDTFHGWALEEVRRASSRELVVQPDLDPEFRAQATQVKRNAGMPEAIGAFVKRQRERLLEWLHHRLSPYGTPEVVDRLRDRAGPPVFDLHEAWADARNLRDRCRGSERARWEQVCRVLAHAVRRMTRHPEDLLNLLKDRTLLQGHLRDVPPWDIDMTARRQETLMAGGRKRSKGQQTLPDGPVPVTFEDFALLLQLIERKHGGLVDPRRPHPPRRHAHLVIDEAQDFGPVELDTLFRVVRGPSDVTVVGDLNQKVVPDAAFLGWTQVARRLGLDRAAVAQLEVGHRSTGSIMGLADHLIGARPSEGRPGPVPALHTVDDENARDRLLIERLERRQAEHPQAHQCVVCRHREEAEALFERLQPQLAERQVEARLGHNKSFVFAPGVTVSNLRQLKGLEFDTVLLVDPSETAYPATEESRRYLYTLVTRARERLHVVSCVPVCQLLQGAVDAGKLDVEEPGTVQPAVFAPEEDAPF